MTNEMKESVEELLREIEIDYDASDIKKRNSNWSFSIASTSLKENAIVIVGFNWGAEKDEVYHAQKPEQLNKDFREIKEELGSFKRVHSKLETELLEEKFNNIVQTNFCFFRSEKEDQISKKDLDISSLLFDRLLQILKPECILSFSKKLYSYLKETGKLDVKETKDIISNGRTFEIAKGVYQMEHENIPIYFLPHPNAKLSRDARGKSWEFLFESINELKANI